MTILNRCDHAISYNTAIETEMSYTHFEKNLVVPLGIHTIDGLHSHVTFDNFDRFVNTCGGEDTLHDTVRIVYQMDSTRSISAAEKFVVKVFFPNFLLGLKIAMSTPL